ncbi:MAG: D-alanine--poly(phosphoribitol) ligase subunit 2 [Chloroflexi bacterium]|nr:D-alanine--poly(phosphoribitol) ligase subunit 2 [Chloroflexota bacterium]
MSILAPQDIEARVLRCLVEATGTEEIVSNPDLRLFETGLLDSVTTVTLIIALAGEFDLEISPLDFDRRTWATPARIVNDVRRRLIAG